MRKIYIILAALCAISTAARADVNVTVYYSDNCPHCHHAREFIKGDLIKDYPNLKLDEVDVPANVDKFRAVVRDCKLSSGGVPVVVIGNECFQGFGNAETTGKKYRDAIDAEMATDTVTAADDQPVINTTTDVTPDVATDETNSAPSAEPEQIAAPKSNTAFYLAGLLAILLIGLGFVIFTKKKK